MIWEEPMENYFEYFPEKRPQWSRTNLWRCYVATFEIIDDELWVIDIKNSQNVSITNECLDGSDRMKIWTSPDKVDRKLGS